MTLGAVAKRANLSIFLPALIVAGLLAHFVYGQSLSATRLQIRIPPDVEPETVRIYWFASTAHGGQASGVRTLPGVYDYPLPIDPETLIALPAALRVLIYMPGYQFVAESFNREQLTNVQTILEPPTIRLPRTTVTGRLVDSSNRPLGLQSLTLSYTLVAECSFFGLIDCLQTTIEIGKATTDESGAFLFDVPSFDLDPFLQKYKPSLGDFQLGSSDSLGSRPDFLRPPGFAVTSAYAPLVVVKMQAGTLSGHLGKEFFQQNGLPGDLTPYVHTVDSRPFSLRLDADTPDGRSSRNAMLKADGTFEVLMPPGTYDLSLLVLGPGFTLQKKISVEKGLAIEEGKRRVVERP